MGTIASRITTASQITSFTSVYSTVYSDTDQRKYQSSASLAFVGGIHRRPVNSPHRWPVTRKLFPFDDVIMIIATNYMGATAAPRPSDSLRAGDVHMLVRQVSIISGKASINQCQIIVNYVSIVSVNGLATSRGHEIIWGNAVLHVSNTFKNFNDVLNNMWKCSSTVIRSEEPHL